MLPKVETPKAEHKIASTGEVVEYRPFLVKEDKILMLAMQDGNYEEMVKACIQIVDNCTFNKIDAATMPIFDLQDLFLQIRMLSVGEIQEFNLICGEEDCKESIKYDLNLKELIVEGLDNLPDDEIKVGDEFVIKMRWPSALDLIKGNDEQVTDLELVSDCIHSIVTEEEETLVENVEKEELEDFINDLPVDAFEKMRKFIHGMPVLQHTVEYACPKCEKEQLVGINGYEHFFG